MTDLALAPMRVNRTVRPEHRANAEYRTREYLLPEEVERLIAAAKKGRAGRRDATLLLVAYRHGLRAAEACALRWPQVDFANARLHVSRLKGGMPSVHPILGDELRALRQLKREQEPSEFIFVSERKAPFEPGSLNRHVKRLGRKAGFEFPLHFHMLRHARGYVLVNDGMDIRSVQAYLGHANIGSTVRYSALSAEPFRMIRR